VAENIDDWELELRAKEEQLNLVSQIWQYTLALEEYVGRLRRRINQLAVAQNLREPYPDPLSDFALRFHDYPAYDDFKKALQDGEPEQPIIEY